MIVLQFISIWNVLSLLQVLAVEPSNPEVQTLFADLADQMRLSQGNGMLSLKCEIALHLNCVFFSNTYFESMYYEKIRILVFLFF